MTCAIRTRRARFVMLAVSIMRRNSAVPDLRTACSGTHRTSGRGGSVVPVAQATTQCSIARITSLSAGALTF
eukprot:10771830-Alexandrium_andersonii.AAC.1